MIKVILAAVILLLIATSLLSPNFKKRRKKPYMQEGRKFIFLRANSEPIRNLLREYKIKLCPCALNFTNSYLYTTDDGALVCGFNESHTHLIADARKNKMDIIDCGHDISMFVREINKLTI